MGRVVHCSYLRLAILSTSNAIVLQYTEFTAYTAILQGGPPPILQESVIARHRQTWKLREHHLIGADPSDSGVEEDRDPLDVLSAGDPLRSYFPPGTQIREHQDRIEVQEPGRRGVLFYQRTGVNGSQYFGVGYGKGYVQDIVITGEARSFYRYPLCFNIDCLRAIRLGVNSTSWGG